MCKKDSFMQINQVLSLIYPYAYTVIPFRRVRLDLLSTHPCFVEQRKIRTSTLTWCTNKVVFAPTKLVALGFVRCILAIPFSGSVGPVLCYGYFLIMACLHCPRLSRLLHWDLSDVINVLLAFLGLIFISHLSLWITRDASFALI
jgi:hypothetical protein